jgi:peptidyl-prolyl cis-trans isomerase B (cyclophilin B)
VSPHVRDRDRENRDEKVQSVLAQRGMTAWRTKQILGIVLATTVVIGGFAVLSLVLNTKNKTASNGRASARATAASALAHRAPQATGQATSTSQSVARCAAPPQVPTDQRRRTLPDKSTAAGKTFIATVTTSCGVITMELYGTKAPRTVASFLSLAKSGYWADSPCHRLTTEGIFVLQCGDPTGTGTGSPGYGYGVENAPANSAYPPGTLAMARSSDPNTNGGQFFIVYKQTVLPDPIGYSIFGRITSGMDIVDRIAAAGASPADANQNTAPMQPISILMVNVAQKKASQ